MKDCLNATTWANHYDWQSKSVTFFSWHFWRSLLHFVHIYRSKVSFTLVKGCTLLEVVVYMTKLRCWRAVFRYVTLQKYFSHPSLIVIYFFPTPPIKLKLGLQTGGRLLIVAYLDQSNYVANQQPVSSFAVPSTSLFIMYKIWNLWKKP
jgi:hypothetical protein